MAIDLNLITDTALRDQLIALGITIPHASSVINAGLFDFNDQFYYKLLAMEAYTYDHSTTPDPAGVPEYQPFWTDYNTALMAYVNHAPISNDVIDSFVQGYYSFLTMYLTKNIGDASTYTNSNAKLIFNMNGLVEAVAGYTLEYYDDFVLGTAPDPDTAANLEADTAALSTAWDTDLGEMSALTPLYVSTFLGESTQGLFGNQTEVVTSITIQEMWDTIFDVSNWQWYITYSGSTYSIPPRPA